MDDVVEIPVTLAPPSWPSNLLFFDKNNSVLGELLACTFTNSLWEDMSDCALAYGFILTERLRALHNMRKKINNELKGFIEAAHHMEQQGYENTQFTVQLQLNCPLTHTSLVAEMTSHAGAYEIRINTNPWHEFPPHLDRQISLFAPTLFPSIVDAVRLGEMPQDVPFIILVYIQDKLKNDPQWRGERVSHINVSVDTLELYHLHMRPTLFFQPTADRVGVLEPQQSLSCETDFTPKMRQTRLTTVYQ